MNPQDEAILKRLNLFSCDVGVNDQDPFQTLFRLLIVERALVPHERGDFFLPLSNSGILNWANRQYSWCGETDTVMFADWTDRKRGRDDEELEDYENGIGFGEHRSVRLYHDACELDRC